MNQVWAIWRCTILYESPIILPQNPFNVKQIFFKMFLYIFEFTFYYLRFTWSISCYTSWKHYFFGLFIMYIRRLSRTSLLLSFSSARLFCGFTGIKYNCFFLFHFLQVYQIFGHLSVLCRCRHSKSSWIRFLIHWSILFEIILKSSNRTFAAVFCWILFTNTMPFYLDKVILDNSFVFARCNHSFLKKKSQKKISDH